MDINTYIDTCLVEHTGAAGDVYCIIPKLNKNIGYTTIEYIFCNLHLNNIFIAETFLFSILDDNVEFGPIFYEDIKVILN